MSCFNAVSSANAAEKTLDLSSPVNIYFNIHFLESYSASFALLFVLALAKNPVILVH